MKHYYLQIAREVCILHPLLLIVNVLRMVCYFRLTKLLARWSLWENPLTTLVTLVQVRNHDIASLHSCVIFSDLFFCLTDGFEESFFEPDTGIVRGPQDFEQGMVALSFRFEL